MSFISLNLNKPSPVEKKTNPVEKRTNPMENPSMSLSAAFLAAGIGTYTDSNEKVTETSAIEVPTVLACIRILSEGVSQLPLRVYEELVRGRRPAKSHYLYPLLTQRPNPEMSAITFFQTIMTHAVLWQNAYAEIERDTSGRVLSLVPRSPWRTKPVRKNGVVIFETTDTLNGQVRLIDAKNMIHIPGFSLDGLAGTPLIYLARQSIGLAMVAARFGARYYANGARPGFFLQPDGPLSPEDMTLLRQDVEALSSGANVHRVAAIPSGIKITDIPIDPAQSEYNATRKFEREEIAAFFRVPGYMVGASEKTLKSTIEAQSQEFLTSLLPWIEKIQQEFQYKLLPTMGRSAGQYSILFYKKAILSVDEATKTACNTQARNGGWLSVNDIRESEDMEPIPGGDTYLQPLNFTPITTASVGVETDDEPEVDPTITATRAIQLYQPIFKDAFSRLQHRSKKDLETITSTLSPAITALGAYFRTDSTAGTSETQAIDKYLKGLESRVSALIGDITDTEMNKLLKYIVFAVEADKAEQRAKKVLNNG